MNRYAGRYVFYALIVAFAVWLVAAARAAPAPERLVAGFACIHRYEAAWNDRGAPYWGGLQMDWQFQRAYGPEYLRAFGTADHWPPALQIAVAIRAYLAGRGYDPLAYFRAQVRAQMRGEPMAEWLCSLCNEPVDPTSQWTWHRIHGWERSLPKRSSGAKGGSDIALRVRKQEFAHPGCVMLARDGLLQQEQLL